MANLPSYQNKSSNKLTAHQMRLRERIVDLMCEGEDFPTIAKRLGRGDKKKQRAWRIKLRRWASTDEYFVQCIHIAARGLLTEGLSGASSGISRRAGRGRTDAAKLLFEATKFHSPKTMHEHSGEIKITMDLPRPPRELQEQIVDAEVVED